MLRLSKMLFILFLFPIAATAQDAILEILRDELHLQMDELCRNQEKPYYMNFRAEDNTVHTVAASFGTLRGSMENNRTIHFMSQIRLGDMQFDSYLGDYAYAMAMRVVPAQLPIYGQNIEAAIRQAIWRDVNARYKNAVDYFEMIKAQSGVISQQQDPAPNFTDIEPEKYYEPPFPDIELNFDRAHWETLMREYSVIPIDDPNIITSEATLNYTLTRRYFVGTDGAEIVQNLTYCTMNISVSTMAEDGMELPLFKTYFAFTPDGLPTPESVKVDITEMAYRLKDLRGAPIVQAYTGPALLSGDASGVFFHEIFGHRIEAQPMKNMKDGQTFKNLVGQEVLPAALSVYDDPTANQYNGKDLNGFYKYDEQGVRAERVDVVVDGVLRDFLTTRTAIEGFDRTNGHGRAQMGFDPTSRQSNLIIETNDPKSEEELRRLLIEEAKAQGKDYGFFFKQVTGGFTVTSAMNINSFQVNPLEVYKVYTDLRPDELVRGVDLIGTPLSMFSNILYAGDDASVFTGICGATSGNIPVTAISPMIMVNKVEVQRRAAPGTISHILPRP